VVGTNLFSEVEAMIQFEILEFVPQTNEQDMNQLLPAFLEIWNDPENLKYLSLTLRPFEEETVRSWFSMHISGGGRYFCAVDTGRNIVEISATRLDPIKGFEVIGVGVLPSRKRQGIGTMLMKHLVQLAKTSGFQSVEVNVLADNVIMLRLLLGLGFIPIRMEHSKRTDGADLVFLRKVFTRIITLTVYLVERNRRWKSDMHYRAASM